MPFPSAGKSRVVPAALILDVNIGRFRKAGLQILHGIDAAVKITFAVS